MLMSGWYTIIEKSEKLRKHSQITYYVLKEVGCKKVNGRIITME